MNPVTLTFDLLTLKPCHVYGHPKVIPWTKFEHFVVIRFWVMLRTNKQTKRQTDLKMISTPTEIVAVCN